MQREEKLKQNQQIQRYFDDYRELMAWASEVIAKITSPDLASDLTGAETLIARHKELRSELDAIQKILSEDSKAPERSWWQPGISCLRRSLRRSPC